MKIKLNGKCEELDRETSVAQLLERFGVNGQYVAVAVNYHCVPRQAFAQFTVRENDEIEILTPQAGG